MGTSIEYIWCMPNSDTLSMPPVSAWVEKYLRGTVVDPFARNDLHGTITNDINPDTKATHHLEAHDFAQKLIDDSVKADCIIFDPPYSLRQAKECYENVGRKFGLVESQVVGKWRELKELLANIVPVGGRALSFGWHSGGFGKKRGFRKDAILLCCHGGAHNDTICLMETKIQGSLFDGN